MAGNSDRPLAPHVQAAIARAAQPKTADFGTQRQLAPHVQRAISRPFGGGAVLPAGAKGWRPGAGTVVQRSARDTVRLGSQSMSPEYAELVQIWFSYSPDDGKNYGDRVARDFKVATYLGIDPYRTDNHASRGAGGPGEGQKAQEERANYLKWRAANSDALDSVDVIEDGGGGGGKSGLRHNEEQEKEAAVRKAEKKATKKDAKHTRWHQNQGHVQDPGGGYHCKVCGETFRTR